MISHNLNDVFAVADRVAVLYLGRLVYTGDVADNTTQGVVQLITTGTNASAPVAAPPAHGAGAG